MRRLVHLSDLHFGRVDEAILDPLVAEIVAARPHVVVVSGDLTQRARTPQFRAAAAFLARLPFPQVVVPGNHDVPLYNLFDRFLRPLTRFRKYITADEEPEYIDDEIAVLGVNTARSLVAKNGRIDGHQVAAVRAAFAPLGPERVRVVVTHHPFDVPDGAGEDRVRGASRAMTAFAACGVDVLLAGHMHVSHRAETGGRYALSGYEALAISAGTATSTRARGESNSFNVLRLSKARVEVERREWQSAAGRFEAAENEAFERRERGWEKARPG